jgi:MbtH protein
MESLVSSDDKDPVESYIVLVNEEEQHSLWPSHKAVPAGWRNVGVYGSKEDCLEYIEKAWTDITPLSVRQRLAAARQPRN